MVGEVPKDVEIVRLDAYGWRSRISGVIGNRALGARHKRCEDGLKPIFERLCFFDGRLPAFGRKAADQM